MKIQVFIFALFLFSSCNFFSANDKNKTKAVALHHEISTLHKELLPQIQSFSEIGKQPTQADMSINQMELKALGYTIDNFYKSWKKGFENFEQQQVYLNYDLQVIRLEDLQDGLKKIEEVVQKAEKLQ